MKPIKNLFERNAGDVSTQCKVSAAAPTCLRAFENGQAFAYQIAEHHSKTNVYTAGKSQFVF